jgi:hypothetical protein
VEGRVKEVDARRALEAERVVEEDWDGVTAMSEEGSVMKARMGDEPFAVVNGIVAYEAGRVVK